jgi:HSP20 family molecular chaperone IbpA
VKISADADFLSVVAETDDETRSFLTKQVRRVRISDEVDPNGIKAKLENGILFLEISRRVKDEPVDIVIN